MKLLRMFLVFSVCLSLLTACAEESTYSYSYEDGYEDGYNDGQAEGYDNGYWEGYSEAEGDLDSIVGYNATQYASEYSGWHPDEAMCIIDAYENGECYYGNTPVTTEDYKDAIASLYHFYEYFYNAMYEDDMECDYD